MESGKPGGFSPPEGGSRGRDSPVGNGPDGMGIVGETGDPPLRERSRLRVRCFRDLPGLDRIQAAEYSGEEAHGEYFRRAGDRPIVLGLRRAVLTRTSVGLAALASPGARRRLRNSSTRQRRNRIRKNSFR